MKIDWAKAAFERAKSGHALFGASTLSRVDKCRGSVRFALENHAKDVDTEWGLEGSLAHALGERALKFDTDTASFVKRELHVLRTTGNLVYVVKAEMAKEVQKYVDWCNELPSEYRFIESRVDLSKWSPIPHQFGTADFAVLVEIAPNRYRLVVIDLKYGMLFVDVVDNLQLISYGLGFLEEYASLFNIVEIELRICQPRLDYFGVQKYTPAELRAYAPKIQKIIETAIAPNPPLKAGVEQCRWCPMRGRCSVQEEFFDRMAKAEFDDFDNETPFAEVTLLDIEDLQRLYEQERFARDWLNAVTSRFAQLLADGAECDYKLVDGRLGHRRYVSEAKAIKLFTQYKISKEKMYEHKLISPAKAEELLPKPVRTKLKDPKAGYVMRPPGRPTIVPMSDERPRCKTMLEEFEEFDDIDSSDEDDGLGE